MVKEGFKTVCKLIEKQQLTYDEAYELMKPYFMDYGNDSEYDRAYGTDWDGGYGKKPEYYDPRRGYEVWCNDHTTFSCNEKNQL